MSLNNKIGLKNANITHVITVLRMEPDEQRFDPFEHLHIHVDDVADENLLEHFPATNAFIQSALDGGGGVLVHWSVPTRCLPMQSVFVLYPDLFSSSASSCDHTIPKQLSVHSYVMF